MVLIRQFSSEILLGCGETLLHFNLEEQEDRLISIPPNGDPQRAITSLEWSSDGQFFAVSFDNKQVVIFSKNFQVERNFLSNRCPSKLHFTPENELVVADRTGDVFVWNLREDQAFPKLLLGHLSVVLDVIVSPCGKYIITCDRDEKIRVSSYPDSYNIISYCLGHTEFVVSVKLVGDILVSASGDGTVRFWNFLQGEELGIINTNSFISEPNLEEQDKAIPISDMQVYNSCNLFVAISLHKCNYLQLYATDIKTCKSIFLRKIETLSNCTNLSFHLNNFLLILSDKFSCFKLINENYQRIDEIDLEKLYEKHKSFLSTSNKNLEMYYKRKFDNVQEYLERKKLRLSLNPK